MREDARLGALVSLGWGRRSEQFACAGDVVNADAAGERAVMANAVKAGRQDMDKEAANELALREPHDFLPRAALWRGNPCI